MGLEDPECPEQGGRNFDSFFLAPPKFSVFCHPGPEAPENSESPKDQDYI